MESIYADRVESHGRHWHRPWLVFLALVIVLVGLRWLTRATAPDKHIVSFAPGAMVPCIAPTVTRPRIPFGYTCAANQVMHLINGGADMLEWLFGSRPPPDAPTEKQLRYARKLGIAVPANADKSTLSFLIGQAESRDPSLRTKREQVKEKQRVRKHGQDRIDEEARWRALAHTGKWMLVVFTRGKSKVAEVVRINGAGILDSGKITIAAEVMKFTNDRLLGPLVDVGRFVEISVDKITWHEIIDEVAINDVRLFQTYYDRVKSRA